MATKHKIAEVSINDLIPAEYNPRQMTTVQAENLTESIKRFGLVDPLIVNSNSERNNIIIGGHQRFFIAKQLHIDIVPVVYVDLNEDQEKELNLRLNRNTGEWDFDALANFDMDLLKDVGWTDEELEGIFQLDMEEEPNEKEVDENIETDNKCPKCGYVW